MRLRWIIIVLVVVFIVVVSFYATDYVRNSGGPVGARGRDMLSGPFLGIQFEIDYMPGMRPDPGALDRFAGFVFEHTGKLVFFSQSEIQSYAGPSSGDPTLPCLLPPCPMNGYTMEQIGEIYDRERSVLPPPGVISVYILYADLPSSEGEQVGAASFCATCVVLFRSGADANYAVEAIILAHEFGHLLGLCSINYPDVRSHCDAGHSTNPNDLMYYAPNTNDPDVQALRLDANDLADLQDLRSGAL